ncbi:MAG: hypothetical protein IJ251_03845 [Oscillospiraceae bacterium]|nr:hypothetical protein [Oscillospiraceae bacterium]
MIRKSCSMWDMRLIAGIAAVSVIFGTVSESYAAETAVFTEPDHGTYTVDTSKTTEISELIFGINDNPDLEGVRPSALKQSDTAITTYNWEINASNAGLSGGYANDVSLVKAYSSASWRDPGLFTELLMSRAAKYAIPHKYVTLQMMGYVAGDAMGVVTEEDTASRWREVAFTKHDAYSTRPDNGDGKVFMDEYISFIADRYGSASSGGADGYFLDNEPDKWTENFALTGVKPIDPDVFAERSAELAWDVKTIDSKALVFGPSFSGLSGCINGGNDPLWDRKYSNDYSWFIDHYLVSMKQKSIDYGIRLLDVLDVHYFTEALTPMGTDVLTHSDSASNAYRMQAVRTLWDGEYTENSVNALINRQFTPLIPTFNSSILINYPGTRLSFSEYDFGGGDNMSGAIAEIDALGTFAKEGVYMACLSPMTEDHRFQNTAINLYNDINGGSRFGDILYSTATDDTMGSCWAGTNGRNDMTLIVTNQNLVTEKQITVDIKGGNVYSLDNVYTVDDNADIVAAEADSFVMENNKLTFAARPYSVYLIKLSDTEENETSPEDFPEDTQTTSETTAAITSLHDTTASEEPVTESETEAVSQTETSPVTYGTMETEVTEGTSVTQTTELTDITDVTIPEKEPNEAPFPLKAAGIGLSAAAFIGALYVLIGDRRLK